MAPPDISVIVPVYKAAGYVGKGLQSLAAQSLAADRFEVICVDDGSPDDTLAVLEAHAAAHGNVIALGRAANGGPGPARNSGLERARGEYLFFLDADDYLVPQALETVLTHARAQDADAVFYSYVLVQGTDDAAYARRKDMDFLVADRDQRVSNFLAGELDGSVIFSLVRRSLFTEHGITFPPGLHEDIPVIYRVHWHAARIAVLGEDLYFKRYRPDSIINSLGHEQIDGLLAALRDVWAFTRAQAPDLVAALQPRYRRGLVGAMVSLIEKALVYFPTDAGQRLQYYSYILDNIVDHGDFAGMDLPTQSKKDRIFTRFMQAFHGEADRTQAMRRFEDIVGDGPVVDSASFTRNAGSFA
ncbi:MAG: Glycosyltransferases involved in cell wall [Rhodospirillaceae bacterium]|nr:MAG: Glycosyltransferases involved in cell wall [Rhodospirillaceae bacterium]TNC96698.1 MAG: Glycosyltransferases involved in cell wall bioproteini [Stygiobacter sp.]